MADKESHSEPLPVEEETAGGWGSWWSNAVSGVRAVTSNVTASASELYTTTVAPTLQPALSKVSEKTNQFVQDLSDIIDPGDEEDDESINEDRRAATAPASSPAVEIALSQTNDVENGGTAPADAVPPETLPPMDEAEEEDEFDVAEMIGQGVSAMQAGAQSLYGLLSRGVETVQHVHVTDLAKQGLEKSKQVLVQGVHLGVEVADKSLGALEKVGEKAMDILVSSDETTSAASGRTNTRPVSGQPLPIKRVGLGVVSGDTPKKKPKEITFESVFEDKLGSTSLQSLENLRIECMMKTQQLYRKLDAEKRESFDEQFAALEELFNLERQPGTIAAFPSGKFNERIEQKYANFTKFVEKSKEKMKSLRENMSQHIDEFRAAHQDDSSEPNVESDLAGLVVSNQIKLRQESILQLGEMAAMAVDLIMRIAEALRDPKLAPQLGLAPLPVSEKANVIHDITDWLSEEITSMSSAHIESVRLVGTALKSMVTLDRETAQTTESEMNAIYVDACAAVSNISEAKKFTLHLFKFLLIDGNQQPESGVAPQ